MAEKHRIFNRVGQFSIKQADLYKGEDWVWQLFARVIVLRCELVSYGDQFEYVAAGPDFEELPEGDFLSRYYPVLERKPDGTTLFQGFRK